MQYPTLTMETPIEGDVNNTQGRQQQRGYVDKSWDPKKANGSNNIAKCGCGVNSKEGASQAAMAEILAAVATPTTEERKHKLILKTRLCRSNVYMDLCCVQHACVFLHIYFYLVNCYVAKRS